MEENRFLNIKYFDKFIILVLFQKIGKISKISLEIGSQVDSCIFICRKVWVVLKVSIKYRVL